MLRTVIKRLHRTVIFSLILLLPPAVSFAQYEYIDINNPFHRKIPMAIPDFSPLGDAATDRALLEQSTDILTKALDFTGYFKLLDRDAYLVEPGKPVIAADQINFKNWTTIGAELLVTGGLEQKGSLVVITAQSMI